MIRVLIEQTMDVRAPRVSKLEVTWSTFPGESLFDLIAVKLYNVVDCI